MKGKAVLLIYMEATPYIIGLVERLRVRWEGRLHVLFAGQNLSQSWGDLDCPVEARLVPRSMGKQLSMLQHAFSAKQYALVHLAGWSGAPVFKLAMLLAAWHGVPLTVESDTPSPWRQAWYKSLLKRWCYPGLFRLPTHFFPGGQRQAAYLRQYGVAESRITQVQMTVDVAKLLAWHADINETRRAQLRASFGIATDSCIFLYVGRLEPHKGLCELLEAFRFLQDGMSQAYLLIVGSGSLSESLQRNPEPRIVCSGRLDGERLLEAYAVADVFVLPSRFEPWGLVINEAMAASLPVLVSDRVGCIDDLVIEGITGVVVPAEAPAALAQAMQTMLEQGPARKLMGEQARHLISGWTLENEADIIAGVWNTLVRST